MFREIVDELVEESTSSLALDDRGVSAVEHGLASAYARTTAIPYGRHLSLPEMQALIDQLFATSEPFVSPSGRPTIVRMSLDELDRRFTP